MVRQSDHGPIAGQKVHYSDAITRKYNLEGIVHSILHSVIEHIIEVSAVI